MRLPGLRERKLARHCIPTVRSRTHSASRRDIRHSPGVSATPAGVGIGEIQGSGSGTSTLTGPITIPAATASGGHFAGGGACTEMALTGTPKNRSRRWAACARAGSSASRTSAFPGKTWERGGGRTGGSGATFDRAPPGGHRFAPTRQMKGDALSSRPLYEKSFRNRNGIWNHGGWSR